MLWLEKKESVSRYNEEANPPHPRLEARERRAEAETHHFGHSIAIRGCFPRYCFSSVSCERRKGGREEERSAPVSDPCRGLVLHRPSPCREKQVNSILLFLCLNYTSLSSTSLSRFLQRSPSLSSDSPSPPLLCRCAPSSIVHLSSSLFFFFLPPPSLRLTSLPPARSSTKADYVLGSNNQVMLVNTRVVRLLLVRTVAARIEEDVVHFVFLRALRPADVRRCGRGGGGREGRGGGRAGWISAVEGGEGGEQGGLWGLRGGRGSVEGREM